VATTILEERKGGPSEAVGTKVMMVPNQACEHPAEDARAGSIVDPACGLTVVINERSSVPLMYWKEDSMNSDRTDTATLPTGPIVMLLSAIVTADAFVNDSVASSSIPMPVGDAR
jgi:hypothetical protein